MFVVLGRKYFLGSPLLVAVIVAAGLAGRARAEASGPDAWRVSGNAAVTIRMGPGTEYPTIGTLPAAARHLHAVTCVPLFTDAQISALSPQARRNLPARWCLVEGGGKRGWVAQVHLHEDTLAEKSSRVGREMPGPDAVAVVRAFFEDYNDDGIDKLDRHSDWARQYFFSGLAKKLARHLFDGGPLYPGQDSDITDLRVRSDPAHPPLRGMTTVLVTYRDYGQPQQMRVYLRSDPDQGGAQRIFRIETADGRTIE